MQSTQIPNSGPRTLALIAAAGLALAGCHNTDEPSASPSAEQGASTMKLTSTAFADGQAIPAEFTCDGAGRSPPLQWSQPPAGTQSFALVVEDPDAAKGPFRHWGVYNLPMSARQLNIGAGESGARALRQAVNDFGEAAYGPPCPPSGDKPHHYRFRLLALDIERLSGEPRDAKAILKQSDRHVLGSAELVGTYQRR